jgi:hypothetical protein
MRPHSFLFLFALLSAIAGRASASVLYVDANSTNSTPPYTTWSTAATNIQDAVDAAVEGDEIVVTNGTYAGGGRGGNRVVVDKALTVRSVNGPSATIIDGAGSVRCVYLTNAASLSGFTLTNGYAAGAGLGVTVGGGVWCASASAVVSDCVVSGNSVYGFFPGFGSFFSSVAGGGAYGGTLNRCSLTRNSAIGYFDAYEQWCGDGGFDGGGLCWFTIDIEAYGGGAGGCVLNNCILDHNTAQGGGGGYFFFPFFGFGSSSGQGGGAYECTLNNCALAGNEADFGGGVSGCTLNNCALTGNSGGGASSSTLTNCIVYFNAGGNYDSQSALTYCCSTPQPTNGVGNISVDPQLASASHLSAGSPCRGAGSAADATGTDIDGEPWADPPSMGCDEYRAGAVTGPLSVGLSASATNVAIGFGVQLTALVEGRTTDSVWDFGDGTIELNQPYTSHAWTAPGDYLVALWAFSESHPEGVNATVTIRVLSGLHYVDTGSINPVAPFTSWSTAATNIQDAINAATEQGTVAVIVTNGTYTAIAAVGPLSIRSVNGPRYTIIDGGHSNRCASLANVGNAPSLSGFTLTNGVSSAGGGGALGGTLNNCTLTGNSSDSSGGGAFGCILNDCILSGNRSGGTLSFPAGGGAAYACMLNNCTMTGNHGHDGGGAFGCALNNCTLAGNWATNAGGGANSCTLTNCRLDANWAEYGGGTSGGILNNCILTGNSAQTAGGAGSGTLNNCVLSGNWVGSVGGGASSCTLNNCALTCNSATNSDGGASQCTLNNSIVYFNITAQGTNHNYGSSSILNYSCTTPPPTDGLGNITNAPMFVDQAGGNLRLQSNSPCINAGNNSYLTNSYFTNSFDLDDNPRIVGGTVDLGAYEFQAPTSIISYAWLQQYGLPTDGSADFTDPDGDGLNNWQEWRCGTDPTNALSALRLLAPVATVTNVAVTWQSVPGISYFLERSSSLAGQPPFSVVQAQLVGQPGTTTFTDTNAVGPGPFFYRVGVAPP